MDAKNGYKKARSRRLLTFKSWVQIPPGPLIFNVSLHYFYLFFSVS